MLNKQSLKTVDRAVVLLSGGLDSSTLLHYVVKKLGAREVHAVSFLYGQKHRRELEAAAWQAKAAGVTAHDIVDMEFFGALLPGASALTDAAVAVPRLADLDSKTLSQPPTYVPNRNMMLLSVAAAYAEARGIRDVFYGAQTQDSYGYWDCTPVFVERVNAVLALNHRPPVLVHAPFVWMRKTEEIALGLELGVDYAHTWTCYRGNAAPCGECPSCVERTTAFKEAGIVDPLMAT
jgi:7-cyano-7-deazaguanine synthase